MFHNLITRTVEFANRRPSRRHNFTKCDGAIIEEEKTCSFLFLSLSLSVSFSFSRYNEILFFATRDTRLFERRIATANFVLEFSRSGKLRLIDSAIYPDYRILKDVISCKYPRGTS